MLRKNVCEIMLDTTGEGLHKRGYRRNAMEAPLRETCLLYTSRCV